MKTKQNLPNYVVINDDEQDINLRLVLRKPTKPISFPLSKEDIEVIKILEAKYDAEENCAGLAAPQIGFNKPIIIFAVHNDETLKRWRPDLTDTISKTIWINPQYEGVNEEKHTDYEACFSVTNLAGPVARFKSIKYKAYQPTGREVNGIASGFLARVIQHEIDHINGSLFIDHVPPDQLTDLEEYRKKRASAMDQ